MKKSIYNRTLNKTLGLLLLLMSSLFLCASSLAGTMSHKSIYGSNKMTYPAANSIISTVSLHPVNTFTPDTILNALTGNSYFSYAYSFQRNSYPNYIPLKAKAAPPTVVCPGNVTANTDFGVCRASVSLPPATINDPDGLGDITTLTWKMNGATNAASPVTGINYVPAPYIFNKGLTNIIYTVTDALGTQASCSFTVTVNDNEAPTLVCPDDANITIPSCASLTEPVTFYLKEFRDNCGILNFTNDAPSQFPLGTTSVLWTGNDISDNSSQCIQHVNVTSDAPINGIITSQTNVACKGNATGSVTVAGSDGTPPYQYNLNGGAFQGSGTFSSLTAGTYTIIIKDVNDCQFILPVTIIESVTALTASITARTNVLCTGQSNGTATVTASGGTSPYTYSWNTTPVQTGSTATNLTARSYVVTVTDALGCAIPVSVTITEPSPMVVSISKTDVLCSGDSTGTATASTSGGTPPYTYAWLTVPIQTNATATNLPAGTYTVAVFDSLGCFKPAFVTITQPATKFLATITTQVNVACAGSSTGSLTATGSGGVPPYQYNINGGLFQASGTFTNLAAGSYTIIARDANSCSVTIPATITEPALPLTVAITSHTNVLCSGQANGSATVTASGGTLPYTYSWNSTPVQTTATAINLPARAYTVTVTDALGCIKTVGITITQPSPLVVATSKVDVACFGESTGTATAIASGGIPPYTYAWLTVPIQTTATATNLPAGTYTVAVFDSLGCFKPAFVTITQPATKFLASITNQVNVVCAGNNTGSITVTGSDGTPPYQYNINGGAFQASGTFANLAAGSYTIIAQDANNCSVNIAATITAPALALSATITSHTNVLCAGQANGSATVTAAGGTPPYTYSWNTTPVQTTATANNLAVRTYTATVTDAAGCQSSVNISITEPAPLLVATSKTDVGCFGDSTGTATAIASGGSPPYTYAWLTVPIQTTATAINLPVGTYTVAVFDSLGCFKPAFVTISQPPTHITASITSQVNVACAGNTGSVTVESSGGTPPYQYNINGGTLQASGTFSALSAGVYSVTAIDANNCTFNVPVTITEPANALHASITAQVNNLCKGQADGSATVTATDGNPPYTYSWNTSPAQTTSTISNLTAGNYIVTTTDNTGCFVIDTAFITEPALDLSVSVTNQVNYDCATGTNGTITVAGAGGTPNYQYSINGGPFQVNDTFTNLPVGNYLITVKDTNNCEATISADIIVAGLILAADDHFTTLEDTGLNANVMTNDQVLCNLPITVTSNSLPANGTLIINADGTFTYTPLPDFNGSDFFDYVITDNLGATSLATVFITIDPVNDPPVTVNESITVNYNLPASDNVVVNGDFDPDGTALLVSLIPVLNPVHGSFTVAADGSFTYTPDLNYIGNDIVIVSVCDEGIPLPPACTADTIFINVLPPNLPPVTVNEYTDVCQNAAFVGTTSNGGTVFNGDTDLEGNLPLTVLNVPVQDAAHGTFTITDLTTGTFDYSPNTGYSGSDFVVVSICDAGIPVECSNDTIFFVVHETVSANAGNDQTILPGSSAKLSGTASGGSGIYSWDWSPAGSVVDPTSQNTETVILTTDNSFTVTVVDITTGCTDSDTTNVFIDNTNYTPVAFDDYDTTLLNTPVTTNITGNDVSPNGDPLIISFCGVPSHGIVVLNSDNTITYTPYSDFEGDDVLCYTICNEYIPSLCDNATVSIHVKKPAITDLLPYSGISPNSDGSNDVWKVKNIEKYPDNTVIIFSRWGDKLREFANYNNADRSWDGRNEKGEFLPDGTYFYILDVKNVGVLKGWIYLRGTH